MKLFILLPAFIITFYSCSHIYYAPNTPNSPLFSQKGEVRLNGNYVSGFSDFNEYSGAEFQGAVAVDKHAALMMNSLFVGAKEYSTEKSNFSYAELAGGVFKPLDNRQQWIGEIFGGFGFGSANNTYESGHLSKVGSTKIFAQPAIGFKADYFEFSFVPRVSYVNLKVEQSDFSDGDPSQGRWQLDQIRQNPNRVCFEPGIIGRVGGQNVKLQVGVVFSSLSASVFTGYESEFTCSIGLSIGLNPKKK